MQTRFSKISVGYFNPRSPHGERRGASGARNAGGSNFNPRSPHGERRDGCNPDALRVISIHAPRTGSDMMRVISHFSSVFQSTLPARGATRWTIKNTRLEKFQSTLPARGATPLLIICVRRAYFNPRSPHGERHYIESLVWVGDTISIHAPRTGSDSCL